ncbi:unannotated protein [freshwater metagenome]|uniref:Unannotated protein n=1 Tax=freshwater metagenome TaxID=449393 RepID=A0A6J6H7X1_9ZZZZ
MAVTTDLRFSIAVMINSRAGSIPPITSIIKSISGSLTIENGSVVKSAGLIPSCGRMVRTAMRESSIFTPARVESSAVSASNKRATELPTTPQPSMPIRTGLFAGLICLFFHIKCEQICLIFSADNYAGFSIIYCNNWWARHMVVIAGHTAAICTRCWNRN